MPPLLYWPGSHPAAEHEDAPADELWPLGHATHAVDADEAEYVLAAHLVQVAELVAPAAVEYVPAAQKVHPVDPELALYFPKNTEEEKIKATHGVARGEG